MKTSQFCCGHKFKKTLLSPPLCFGQTTANHHPTPHCGLTLIGDQKQTIIQAYNSPGKIAKASYTVKSHLKRPQTLTAVKVSKQQKQRKLQRLPFSEFAQLSRAKRLKFSQKSADDTRFTQPGSQNAILERNTQIIIN